MYNTHYRLEATKVYSAEWKKKKFDNFIMFVWVQGSPFHIAAGSLYRKPGGHKFIQGSNSKVASMLSKTISTNSSCYNDSEKVLFGFSTTYRFVVIEEKVRSQLFGSTGVKQVKMIQFWWQWSQNARLVNTIQIQNSLLCAACFCNMVMQWES